MSTSLPICLRANKNWLYKHQRNISLLFVISSIFVFGGTYLLLFDFFGDYRGGFFTGGDARGAAIALGILGLYFTPRLWKLYSKIKAKEQGFFQADDTGITCYASDHILEWNNIRSIAHEKDKDQIIILLKQPVLALSRHHMEFENEINNIQINVNALNFDKLSLSGVVSTLKDRLSTEENPPTPHPASHVDHAAVR